MSTPSWKKAIVVGASSGIGEALARQLAHQGCQVALVARREGALQVLANLINAEAKSTVALSYSHDVEEVLSVPGLFEKIVQDLGGIDLVIYAAGIMPRIEPHEYDTEKDRQVIAVNFTGAVAWLNEAAQRFEKAGTGTIVGISSVAGDRGRRGFPVYNASKAALNTYLEALRYRIERYGATVVTIKPGYVDTPMTQGIKNLKGMISAETAANAILAAAKNKAGIAYVPAKWGLIMRVVRSIPAPIMKKLNI